MTAQTLKAAALQFHAYGGNITVIHPNSKGPINEWRPLCSRRQTEGEVRRLPWRKAAGVGILNGPSDWRTLDIDPQKRDSQGKRLPLDQITAVPESVLLDVMAALGLPADYRWTWRSGSGKGWEIAFICHGEMPPDVLSAKDKESGVFWGLAKDPEAFEHLELRWKDNQTIYPPSAYEQPEAPGYRWRGEAPDGPPAVVSIGHVLAAFFAVATPKKAEPKAEPKPKRQEHERTQSTGLTDAIAEIKRRFPLVDYAQRHWPGELQNEPDGQIRICGHGGFLINEEKGVWNRFEGEIGGDAIELVGRKIYDEHWDRTDHTMFFAALEEAARETNVELPPPPARGHVPERGADGRYTFRLDAIQPVDAGDDVVTLKRTDFELLQARAAYADYLAEWRAWAMDVARLKTEQLSPAAKVVAFTLWPEMEYRRDNGIEEPQRVYIEEATKSTGLSASTYGAKIQELERAGAIVRIEDRQDNGNQKILWQPSEAFTQPHAWQPEQARNHGGKRAGAGRPVRDCPTCGPAARIKVRHEAKDIYTCAECKSRVPLDIKVLKPKEATLWFNPETGEWAPETVAGVTPQDLPDKERTDASPPLGKFETERAEQAVFQIDPMPAAAASATENQIDRQAHRAPPVDAQMLQEAVEKGHLPPDDPWIAHTLAQLHHAERAAAL
jgi:hypothetical protein